MSSAPQVSKGVTWDLTSYFPEFNGPEMQEFKAKVTEDIAKLQDMAAGLEPLSEGNQEDWEALCLLAEDLESRLGHLFSYVGCLGSADAANEASHIIAKAKEVTIVEKVSASGMVQPVKEISISPDVPGEIIRLTVEEGEHDNAVGQARSVYLD